MQAKQAAGPAGTSPVIQLAALAADKLNVVGEDHAESKPRWQEEFVLSHAKTASPNFWLESMFKVDWSGIHQPDEKKNTRGADPTLERIRYVMGQFSMRLESAFTKLEMVVPTEIDPSLSLPDVAPHEDISSPEQLTSDITDNEEVEDIDLDRTFATDLQEAMTELQLTTADLHQQINLGITEIFYKHLHYLHRPDKPDTHILPVADISRATDDLKKMTITALSILPEALSKTLTDIAYKGKELHDALQQANWIDADDNRIINEPAGVLDDASAQRSLGMHRAANMNYAVTGVWKIGEEHVRDIKRFLAEFRVYPTLYNLVSRSEFQEIYDTYYPRTPSGKEEKKEPKQFVSADEQRQSLHTTPVNQPVVQRMYEFGEDDIDLLLCAILKTFDNEDRALEISRLSLLDKISEEDVKKIVSQATLENQLVIAPLKIALETGNEKFAEALLSLIQKLPEIEETTTTATTREIPDASAEAFDSLIESAMRIHVPEVGSRIDTAQERATRNNKKLLVIVGEGHDDPYSRVMVTVLVAAMQRLNAGHLYIESTPDQIKEHVEPYQEKTPALDDTTHFAHRQHFYHNLYQQGTTVSGVDIDKFTVKEEQKEAVSHENKAFIAEENVNKRNTSIAKTVVEQDKSGVLLVGFSHLGGLASDPRLRSAYEIVTISTVLKEDAEFHNTIAYGRTLSTTAASFQMEDLYYGNAPGDKSEVRAKDAYATARKMVIEVNQY
ncbi:hypothetical protein [Chitinophaga rhizophila]|uniref:Uncharacterized protein n=1 Tax=Chitinophaga rhizophila TaxID=2866212 RepID=A0ABS7GL81_9BACT|nr:hypothetical protein [Chitinophaga rhizophila]MBW8687975.1 hypothetical protein [Chitinophaga rhizophila]